MAKIVELTITHGVLAGQSFFLESTSKTTIKEAVDQFRKKHGNRLKRNPEDLTTIELYDERADPAEIQNEDDPLFFYLNEWGNLLGKLVFKETVRSIGVQFAELGKKESIISRDFNPKAPDWRKVNKGLVIEGECENPQCPSYGKGRVCCSLGFVVFELKKIDKYNIKCCVCESKIKPIKPGYSYCLFKIYGSREDGTTIGTQWEKVGDKYQTYDMEKAGSTNWLRLTIKTQELKDDLADSGVPVPHSCSICHEPMKKGDLKVFDDCGHYVHTKCKREWARNIKSKGEEPFCPLDAIPYSETEAVKHC